MALFQLIHLLSVMVWVGGMFFAYMVLRPSAAEVLQPAERLQLWDKVFSRFFNWVWIASLLTLVSGLYMIYLYGGMPFVPPYVHLMLLLGGVMLLIFVYVFFAQYVRFNLVVAAKDWQKAGAILVKIRQLVATNLILGAVIFAVVKLNASF